MATGEALPDVRQMALSLARSGRFCGWRLVEIEMRFVRGLRAADTLFHDTALREELDTLCRAAQRHRQRHPSLPASPPPIPLYRFRGGQLPRPPVIRFLDEATGPADDTEPTAQPQAAGRGAR